MKTARALYPLLLAAGPGALLSACSATTYVDHGVAFERHELVTGRARSQTVLTGRLLGGAVADLAVVSVDGSGGRRLEVFAHDGDTWAPRVALPLRREVLFVDVAEVGGHERLLAFERGRLIWIDPWTATAHELVRVAARFDATEEHGVPHVDVTRDLNGDGRDDVVLPDLDGFWVALQAADGSFCEPVKLGPPEPRLDELHFEEGRTYRELGIGALTIPWYLSRVHELDYDLDGRSDLAFWDGERFEVHLQDERGTFEPVPVTFAAGVPFDADGVYSHAFVFGGVGALELLFGSEETTRHTVLYALRDLDGDGVADLVTHSLEGRTPLRLRTRLDVHFGASGPDGIRFSAPPSASLRPHGKARSAPLGYALQRLEDLDRDGQVDAVLLNVHARVGTMLDALVANRVSLDLELYRGDEGYADEPDALLRIEPDPDVFGPRGPFFPAALTGDVDGDGLADLVVGQSRNELRFYPGVAGGGLFAERPQKVAVALPDDERATRLVDLDRDGRQDVLVVRRSRTGSRWVTLLIAR